VSGWDSFRDSGNSACWYDNSSFPKGAVRVLIVGDVRELDQAWPRIEAYLGDLELPLMVMVIFFRSRPWPYIDSLIELSRRMTFDELATIRVPSVGTDPDMRAV